VSTYQAGNLSFKRDGLEGGRHVPGEESLEAVDRMLADALQKMAQYSSGPGPLSLAVPSSA
jgi:hypothetical protein